VSLPEPARSPSARLLLILACGLVALPGCGRGGGAPTKIYEGGGTIPEIVEQPEPSAAKKPARGARR
jgi:hypothetical protein